MKYVLGTLSLVALLAFSAGVSSASAPQTGSTIRGRVVDSFNQGPLGGVRVDVFNDANRSVKKSVASTMTSSDGTFSLSGLRSGNYHLELEKRGYALEIVTGFSLRTGVRFQIAEPFAMRTAVVTTTIGRSMETRL